MISEDRMLLGVKALKEDVKDKTQYSESLIDLLNECIDLIPLGWQVASDQADKVNLEVDNETN